LRLALIAAGWLLGVIQAGLEGTMFLVQGQAIPWSRLGWNWLSYGISALFLPWLVESALASRPFARDRWVRQLPALAGRLVLAVILEAAIWGALRKGAELLGSPHYDLAALGRALLDGVFLSNVYLFAVFSIGANAVQGALRLKERDVAAARLESELATTRLRLLKTQLNPHFLFNSLNTVSALVQRDPGAADRMISRLSDFLRVLLDSAEEEEVTLDQELEHLALYAGIQRARFRERLRLDVDVPEELLDVAVPHLILQPLVENAIEHGSRSRRALAVVVRARLRAAEVELTVEDDGRGPAGPAPARPGHHGVGLASTRARLETLYGPGERFTLRPRFGGGAVATVRLPARRLVAAAARPPAFLVLRGETP
jgi:two-component sensor histidine kinase